MQPGTFPARRAFCTALAAAASGAAISPLRVLAADAPLEIGVTPNLSPRLLLQQYQPLRDYLQDALGRPALVSTAPNWSAFHDRTCQQQYDLIITAAHVGRVQQLDCGIEPLQVFLPSIRALLVAHKDRPLARIEALKGETLAFSNPQSLVAIRGSRWLAERNLLPGRDFQPLRASQDDSVANIMMRGAAIAALMSGGEFRAIPSEVRDRLVVVETVAEVAGFLAMAPARLDPQLRQRLDRALDELPAHALGKQLFERTGFTGMRRADDALMKSLDEYADETRRLLEAR